MKIIKKQTLKAKKPLKCELCGEAIKQGEQYTLIYYKFGKTIKTKRCHSNCWGAAVQLEMDKLEDITVFSFDRQCRLFCQKMYKSQGGNLSNKEMGKFKLSYLAMAISDMERIAKEADEVSYNFRVENYADIMEIYILTNMFVYPFDSLIESMALDSKGRRALGVLRQDVRLCEKEANELFNKSKAKDNREEHLRLAEAASDIYEAIYDSVLLDDFTKSANILVAMVEKTLSKAVKLNEKNWHSNIHKPLLEIRKHLADYIAFEKSQFAFYTVNEKTKYENFKPLLEDGDRNERRAVRA
ncbi:MAG: hypothetical protein R3Y50_08760 [Rikenellaceae bacterium]